MSTHDESTNDEANAELDVRLRSLPAERTPSREMRQRTFGAARAAGYVRATAVRPLARSVALIAAGALIFLAGTLLGYALPRRAAPAAAADSTNHQAVAFAQAFTIDTASKRHIVWY